MKSKQITLKVDEDFEIWIHDGHQQLDFYKLTKDEQKIVFAQIKDLETKLEFFKNFTGFYFE